MGIDEISARYFFDPAEVSANTIPPKYAPSTMPSVSWNTLETPNSWLV
ncbi:hypothetical protein [Saccharothrix texasensis]|nr:hypothetical protein [Saccharothrix texasensis]